MAVATKAEEVLRDIEEMSRTQDWLPIIGPVKGKYLEETVRKFGVQNALEVGTLIGYSAVLIARNLPEDGKLVTLEINPASARLATENIVRAGLEKKIEVIVGNALDIIPTLRTGYDMVFIDAAKNEYRDYLRLSEGYLKKGGVVFADNVKVFATSMQDFLDYLRNSGKYTSRTIDVGYDAVEIAIKLN